MKSCVFSLDMSCAMLFLSKLFKNTSVYLTFLLIFKYVGNTTGTKEA